MPSSTAPSMPQEEALNYFSGLCTVEDQRAAPGFHMNWWSHVKAERTLRAAGFTNVYRSGFGQSLCAAMRDVTLFDKQDPKLSMYAEAQK
jgi:hypothetical protein